MTASEPGTPEPTPPAPEEPAAPTGPWSTLSEDLRDNPVVTRHKDVESLVREHIGAQELIGRKGVIPPGSWEDDEDVKRFYQQLGVPEKPDGYDLSKLEVGENWDPELQNQMVQAMHGLGLTERQVSGILGHYSKILEGVYSTVQEKAAETRAASEKQLREKYGNAFDERIRRASKIFHNAWGEASEDLRTLRLEDGSLLGDHPAFLDGLANLGDLLGEDAFRGGDREPQRLTLGPEEAAAKWEELQANPEFQADLYDKERPGHKLAVSRRDALYRAMFPEAKSG